MSGTSGSVSGSSGNTDARRMAEMEREIAEDVREGPSRTDGQAAFDWFSHVARDPRGPSTPGVYYLSLGPGDDLDARGPTSRFGVLADRMEGTGSGYSEAVEIFATTSRDEFIAAQRDALIANGADPEKIATMCEDMAAKAVENLVVRGARDELEGFAAQARRLLADAPARAAFLQELAAAEPGAAREWFESFGFTAAQAEQATWILASTVTLDGFFPSVSCDVPRTHAGVDSLLVEKLGEALEQIGAAQRALSEVGNAQAPASIFEDYGPILDRMLPIVAPDVESIEGSMLEAGVRRAVEERQDTSAAVAAVRSAVRVCVSLAAGPGFSPVVGVALGAADTVYQGANHDRIEAQRAMGISDDRATEYWSWGEAAAHNAAQVAVSSTLGGAVGGGGLISALAGETGAQAYELGARIHGAR